MGRPAHPSAPVGGSQSVEADVWWDARQTYEAVRHTLSCYTTASGATVRMDSGRPRPLPSYTPRHRKATASCAPRAPSPSGLPWQGAPRRRPAPSTSSSLAHLLSSAELATDEHLRREFSRIDPEGLVVSLPQPSFLA